MSTPHDKTPGISRCYCEKCSERQWDPARNGWADAQPKGLVTELATALRRSTDLLWCDISSPQEPSPRDGCWCARCTRARWNLEVLARATPEAVRQADAAPEVYEALVDWQTIELEMNTLGVTCPLEDRLEQVSNQRDRAIAKAEGKMK